MTFEEGNSADKEGNCADKEGNGADKDGNGADKEEGNSADKDPKGESDEESSGLKINIRKAGGHFLLILLFNKFVIQENKDKTRSYLC